MVEFGFMVGLTCTSTRRSVLPVEVKAIEMRDERNQGPSGIRPNRDRSSVSGEGGRARRRVCTQGAEALWLKWRR